MEHTSSVFVGWVFGHLLSRNNYIKFYAFSSIIAFDTQMLETFINCLYKTTATYVGIIFLRTPQVARTFYNRFQTVHVSRVIQ